MPTAKATMKGGPAASKPRKPAAKRATKPGFDKAQGKRDVQAWLAEVKPEHMAMARKIDAMIAKAVPGIVRAAKWRKPSQPLGVPFYGLPGKGWLFAMWSFKDNVCLGMYARGLEPEPPVRIVNGAGIKIHDASEFDEEQLRSWMEQSAGLEGWGAGSAELQ